jgi:hypothetical protein
MHDGLLIAVLTRNEHCPPHVHVGDGSWDARFEFSFWHNSVRLWDVSPVRKSPTESLLERLRNVVKQKPNLQRARELWWESRQTVCLENQMWDPIQEAVVSPKSKIRGAVAILKGEFNTDLNMTSLQLKGKNEPLEIQL